MMQLSHGWPHVSVFHNGKATRGPFPTSLIFVIMSQHLNQPLSLNYWLLLSITSQNHEVSSCVFWTVFQMSRYDQSLMFQQIKSSPPTKAYSWLNLSAPSCVSFLSLFSTCGTNRDEHLAWHMLLPSHMWNIHSFLHTLHTLITYAYPHTLYSLHLTTFCLQYKPTVIACVCIHLACKWSNWEIPVSTDGKHWWEYVDNSVTLELLDGEIEWCIFLFPWWVTANKLFDVDILVFVELTHEFLQILEKTPSRLKRIRNWRVGYVSVLFHALERHCWHSVEPLSNHCRLNTK